jgi:hypothetical protein
MKLTNVTYFIIKTIITIILIVLLLVNSYDFLDVICFNKIVVLYITLYSFIQLIIELQRTWWNK